MPLSVDSHARAQPSCRTITVTAERVRGNTVVFVTTARRDPTRIAYRPNTFVVFRRVFRRVRGFIRPRRQTRRTNSTTFHSKTVTIALFSLTRCREMKKFVYRRNRTPPCMVSRDEIPRQNHGVTISVRSDFNVDLHARGGHHRRGGPFIKTRGGYATVRKHGRNRS